MPHMDKEKGSPFVRLAMIAVAGLVVAYLIAAIIVTITH